MAELPKFTWSVSKKEAAMQCIRKYKRVYIDKHAETSYALSLGGATHELIASELIERNIDMPKLIAKLDSNLDSYPEMYAMSEHIINFTREWVKLSEEKKLTAQIEQKYALNKELKCSTYMGKDVYIRGIFDMWWYYEPTKQLYVLDHKTSKNMVNPQGSDQLQLYVFMLTKIFKIDWNIAFTGFNYIRYGKRKWCPVIRSDIHDFSIRFLRTLDLLEDIIRKCYENDDWPMTRGFHCNWCTFKSECDDS